MEVLWVTGRHFGSDLCQTTQVEVANALKRKGHNVSFLAPASDQGVSILKDEGLDIIRLKPSNIPGLKSISFDNQVKKNLPRILKERTYDAAICSWRGALGAMNALASASIPWILIDRGPRAYTGLLGKLQWKYYNRAFNVSKSKTSAVFTVSTSHADFVKDRFNLEKSPYVISAGATPSRFESTDSERIHPTGIVYHGRLDKSRNILKLIDIGDLLDQNNVAFRMTLVGDGGELSKLTILSHIRKWLTVIPTVSTNEVSKILMQNHIGLLPMGSRLVWRTSSPLKLFEYGAAGLTIIGVDHDGHRLEGKCEFLKLVPEENMVEAMATAIEESIEKNEFDSIGESARRYIRENKTWDHSIESLEKVLQELVLEDNSS